MALYVEHRRYELPGPSQSVTAGEVLQKVEEYFKTHSNNSLRRAFQVMQISKTSFHRILEYFLNFHPYKISVHHLLAGKAMALRIEFCQQLYQIIEPGNFNVENCIFSDETHFLFGGFINKQNFCFCRTEPPHFVEIKFLHPKKVTTWAVIIPKDGFIEFFDSPVIKGAVYCQFFKKHFFPWARKNKLIENFYFMQDGATSHIQQSL